MFASDQTLRATSQTSRWLPGRETRRVGALDLPTSPVGASMVLETVSMPGMLRREVLLIEEAGGLVTDFTGDHWIFTLRRCWQARPDS